MEDNVKESTLENEEGSSFLDVELETLQSIYINETAVQKHDSVTTVSIDLHPATADNLHEQYVKMTLILNIKDEYPKVIPEVDIRNPRGLSDEKLNSITENLIEIAESKKGSSMLFEIIEAAKDHLTAENRPCEECAICLYGFHEEDVFTKTECYHYFHSHCLARYSRNFYLNEEESTSEEESVKNQLLCPVCRFPIHFEDSEEIYPLPKSGDEQFELTESILDLQKKMSELYSKQVEKGGIIDVEAEKNKYLLEIAHVPSETETAPTGKFEDDDVKPSNVSLSPTNISPGKSVKEHSENIKSSKDCEKSVKSNSETRNSKSNEEKKPFKDHRGERIGRDKNFTRDRNERYNSNRGSNRYGNHYTNDRNSYQKNNRYNNERRNNWYERESQSSRYENDRRNDRYRGDKKNERYSNDRYNNDNRNDRYRNDRYNGDTRNDRYGGERRNERYDRRVEKYDQRFARHDHRQHNRFEREHFQEDFKNGSFPRRNRTQNNYEDEGDDANHGSNNKPDQSESPNYENSDTQEVDGNGHDRSASHEIDKQDDWGKDERKDFENDQQDYNKDRLGEYKNDEKNFKLTERNYPRNRVNEGQDHRFNGNSDARFNNRKDNRFDSNRRNYRQNGSRTEFRDYERKNRFSRGRGRYQQSGRIDMNVKSEEREVEDEDVSISPDIGQDENAADSLCVYDSEISQFVDGISEVQTNNSIRDEENAVSCNTFASETSNKRGDSFSGKSHDANRTNKDNYKKWNYGHNTNYPRGKKFNSNAYQKNAGFHSQPKHSESQNSENYSQDCDDVSSAKADDVGKENTSHNEISGSRNFKNDGVEYNDSHSYRKNYRRTNSSNSRRGQPNSHQNYAEGNSRCEEEFEPEPQKDSPKYIPRTSNRRYPQRRYKEDNYEKPLNVQNTNATEAKNDLKKEENPVHKNIPVEESPSQKASKASDVKNSVPTSNFLPPLSSVPPPPGFQNPSRKIVYGLAAANPPPGFNRS